MIDTHLHLDLLNVEPSIALERARQKGVNRFITVGTDTESSSKATAFSLSHEGVFASVGLHPHSSDGFDDASRSSLISLAKRSSAVAVGETGIDLYRNLSSEKSQVKAFEWHINLSNETGLPLIVHQRNAEKEVVSVLKRNKPENAVVMHCFSGSKAFASYCKEEGFFISFSGNVTFKNAKELAEIAGFYPMDLIVIETDSPYLSPEPFRGKENGPENLPLIAEKIAGLRQIEFEILAEIVTGNAERLFDLK